MYLLDLKFSWYAICLSSKDLLRKFMIPYIFPVCSIKTVNMMAEQAEGTIQTSLLVILSLYMYAASAATLPALW